MTTSGNEQQPSAPQSIQPEDSELLSRIGSGDERALASLYDRHCTLVYSIALRVCHDPAAAEEVLQNIFMQVWLSPQQFAAASDGLDGKLILLSRNLAIERMRQPQSSDSPSPGRTLDPIRHTEVSLLLQKPHSLVLLLPDADRHVLDMAFFDGRKASEIAWEIGCPADAVASRIGGALSVLRDGIAHAEKAPEDTGLEVLDLDTNPEFTARKLHTHDVATQMEGLRRLTHSFVLNPDTILQELVNAAVELCGADSAGISLETEEKSDANYWHWVATAGQYNGFLHAILPRYPSACGICLDRGKPQLFRVRQRFFDIMGIDAPLVTDGILLPWQVEETRGTIFIMAHGRTAAFDQGDGQMMRVLADFAALAMRHQQQQQALLRQTRAATAAEVATRLAHDIEKPLQSLIHTAHLAAEAKAGPDAKALGQELSADLHQLSTLITDSLALSKDLTRPD